MAAFSALASFRRLERMTAFHPKRLFPGILDSGFQSNKHSLDGVCLEVDIGRAS
jgi:hypothetical protein